jgi:hypothetical protein
MRFEVKASLYISARDCFMIVVHTSRKFLFFETFQPIAIDLKDGSRCQGIILDSRHRFPKDSEIQSVMLAVESDEIQNPETAVIVGIEV